MEKKILLKQLDEAIKVYNNSSGYFGRRNQLWGSYFICWYCRDAELFELERLVSLIVSLIPDQYRASNTLCMYNHRSYRLWFLKEIKKQLTSTHLKNSKQ